MAMFRYGPQPSQWAQLHPPIAVHGPAPVAVLLHGGWWRDRHGAELMDPLGADLASRGWAVWNVEYRRTGGDGGGWPQTRDDVRAALDLLARTIEDEPAATPGGLSRRQVVAIGHSAGGHLALLTAAETLVTAVVALAPVTDLRRSDHAGLGEGAVTPFLGPNPNAELYRATSPISTVAVEVPQLVVHGEADQRVPVEHSRDYVAAARAAGARVDYHEVAAADHFAVIDPATDAWRGVHPWLTPSDGSPGIPGSV